MAAGDLTLFNDFVRQICEKEIDLADDTFKIALYTSTRAPVVTEATPVYSVTNEVSGTNYTAGGATCSAGMAVSLSGAVASWTGGSGPHASWSQHASGPADIRWGILYDDTATGKPAAGFIEFGAGADISLADGDITFTFNATAIAQVTRS